MKQNMGSAASSNEPTLDADNSSVSSNEERDNMERFAMNVANRWGNLDKKARLLRAWEGGSEVPVFSFGHTGECELRLCILQDAEYKEYECDASSVDALWSALMKKVSRRDVRFVWRNKDKTVSKFLEANGKAFRHKVNNMDLDSTASSYPSAEAGQSYSMAITRDGTAWTPQVTEQGTYIWTN